ncbi:hypothetical protein [Mycolicibacterium sp. XJ870]
MTTSAIRWTRMTRRIAMPSNRVRGVISTALVIALAFVSACDSQPDGLTPPGTPSTQSALPPPLFPNWPPEANEFRFHWSGAPGIDLENGPAIALRAYVESYRLAAFAGGDPSVVYPGFLRATPQNTGMSRETGSLIQLQYVRPKTRAEYEANGWTYVERQVYGYQPTHILSILPQGDGYRATVCVGAYSVYRTADDDPHKFFSTAAEADTAQLRYGDWQMVQIWRIELTDKDPRIGDAPAAPGDPQRGPRPAPAADVFGPWFITGNSEGLWGPLGDAEQIDTPEIRTQCEAAMPDDAAARRAMATGFHASPPPHGEPIPGWPAKSE